MSCELIVNADDFGLCDEVNRGIVAAHVDGIVTATTMMVLRPAAESAAAIARSLPSLAVGLHVDLGEWHYDAHTGWNRVVEVVDVDDAAAVSAEVASQLDRFHQLTGRHPTHLDSHQHVHASGPAAHVLRLAGERLNVPVRLHHRTIQYNGSFYGQTGRGDPYPEGITEDHLAQVIVNLGEGTHEIGCHPGIDVPPEVSVYASERQVELMSLCSPVVSSALSHRGVVLVSPASFCFD
jgi:chitin disaccharide deacetylase